MAVCSAASKALAARVGLVVHHAGGHTMLGRKLQPRRIGLVAGTAATSADQPSDRQAFQQWPPCWSPAGDEDDERFFMGRAV